MGEVTSVKARESSLPIFICLLVISWYVSRIQITSSNVKIFAKTPMWDMYIY